MTSTATIPGRAATVPQSWGRRALRKVATSPWTWFTLVMTAIYVACLMAQYRILTAPVHTPQGDIVGVNDAALRQATGLAWPTLAFWIVFYILLDRWKPQRLLVWYIALGWGACVATASSLVINSWAAEQMQIEGQNPETGARSAVFVAPFVEEAMKASILFLIAIIVRYRLVSRISGLVLAGLSAAGFAFTENIIYYARAIVYSSHQISVGNPEDAVNQLVMMRGVFLAFGHPLFTTMTGIGLVVGLRSQSRTVRVTAPLVGYLAAALGHMSFNTLASTGGGDMNSQMTLYFLIIVPLLLGALWWIVRLINSEGKRIRARLTDFVDAGWLPESDPATFGMLRRRGRSIILSISRGWPSFKTTILLQRTMTDLAYLRDAQTRGIVDASGADQAKALLERSAVLRATAVADPTGLKFLWPDVRGWARRWWRSLRGRREQPALWGPPGAAVVPIESTRFSPVDPRWEPPTS